MFNMTVDIDKSLCITNDTLENWDRYHTKYDHINDPWENIYETQSRQIY